MLKLLIIKTKKEYYITDNNDFKENYYNKTNLMNLFFDDKMPKQSFHEDWVIIDNFPAKIQKIKKLKGINKRYELIDKKLESKNYPLILYVDYFTPINVWRDEKKRLNFYYLSLKI